MPDDPQHSDVERALLDRKRVEKASRLAAAFADARAEAFRTFNERRKAIEAEYDTASPLPTPNGTDAPAPRSSSRA